MLANGRKRRWQKARLADSMRALDQLTTVVDGQRRIASDPPVLVPVRELYPTLETDQLTAIMRELFRGYQRTLQTDRRHILDQFRFIEMARKVVGVGSVGTRAWVVLLLGRDDADPLILQAKEAQESVLAPFVGKSRYTNQGQRVVAGQHLMQTISADQNERDFAHFKEAISSGRIKGVMGG